MATSLATLHAETAPTSMPVLNSDKWQYNLFNPTPRDLMRDMSTDRPDTTESPITVDSGRFQIETSFFEYAGNNDGGFEEEVFTYGAMNMKVGLLNNVDLQLVFDAYTEEKTTDAATGVTEKVDGFSDIQARLKVNLWGNDGGKTALAFFPFIKVPTGTALSNDHVEGGIILPFSIELTDTVGLGLMAEADFVHDGADGYDTEFVHTAVLGFGLTETIGMFTEYVGVAATDSAFDYQASSVIGFTYGFSDEVQYDTGIRVPLNEAADDMGFFAGLSVGF